MKLPERVPAVIEHDDEVNKPEGVEDKLHVVPA